MCLRIKRSKNNINIDLKNKMYIYVIIVLILWCNSLCLVGCVAQAQSPATNEQPFGKFNRTLIPILALSIPRIDCLLIEGENQFFSIEKFLNFFFFLNWKVLSDHNKPYIKCNMIWVKFIPFFQRKLWNWGKSVHK
jgi:hypothetical protein